MKPIKAVLWLTMAAACGQEGGIDSEDLKRATPKTAATDEMQAWLDARYAPNALVSVVTGSDNSLIDCVDKAHQPGLKLPGGGWATMESPPGAIGAAQTPSTGEALATLETFTCPSGTVPMEHLTMANLENFSTLAQFLAKSPQSGDPMARTGSTDYHQYAKVDQYAANHGGHAIFNIWNPYVDRTREFSLTQLWVVRGSYDDKQTVEAGYIEWWNHFVDGARHLFIYSTQDNYIDTGCYNGCGDWVQKSGSVYPGGKFTSSSSYGYTQYIFELKWLKSTSTGNWWLYYGDEPVGYYKHSLFDSSGLATQADRVSYGGELLNDNGADHTATFMGNGQFPSAGWTHAEYMRSLWWLSTARYWTHANSTSEYRTDSYCYDVDTFHSSGDWGYYIYLGGVGYSSDCH